MIYNKERLYENFDEDDPHTSLYVVFQKIGPQTYNFDVDSILSKALECFKQVPPSMLLSL